MTQVTVINELFRHRNINAEVVKEEVGLRTTKLFIKLSQSERVSRIRSLDEDIMLQLKTNSPPTLTVNNGLLVLEFVHQSDPIVIPFDNLLQEVDLTEYKLPLLIGKTMQNKPYVIDLTDSNSPHILIGGTTGAGKSVLLKTIVASILEKYPEYDEDTENYGAEFILIDPKGTELRQFQHYEHTLAYCCTYDESVVALEQAVEVMETRYSIFPSYDVQNLADLREKVIDSDNQYIVIVIDELADLLLQDSKKRLRTALTRLTQKSRAAGIHLVVATQNPKRDVIDGVIKANMPTKIALRTNSSIESRIILDSEGAEHLLGRGDMLISSNGTTTRVQGALLAEMTSDDRTPMGNIVKFREGPR